MTDLNTANLQDTANNALQEALNISPKKTSILLWTNDNPNSPNSFILKDKEGKRYLGLPRKDRKGGDYWKFKEIRSKRSENQKENANNTNASKE